MNAQYNNYVALSFNRHLVIKDQSAFSYFEQSVEGDLMLYRSPMISTIQQLIEVEGVVDSLLSLTDSAFSIDLLLGNRIHTLYSTRLKWFKYSPKAELFYTCYEEMKLDFVNFEDTHSLYLNKTSGDILNDFIALIRKKAAETSYGTELKKLQKQQASDQLKITNYLDSLLNTTDSLTVFRLNLEYQGGYLPQNTLVGLKADFKKLVRGLRGGAVQSSLIGYCCSIEWSPCKGYFYHAFLFFDYVPLHQYAVCSTRIKGYWVDSVTGNNGAVYDFSVPDEFGCSFPVEQAGVSNYSQRYSLLQELEYFWVINSSIRVNMPGLKRFTLGPISDKYTHLSNTMKNGHVLINRAPQAL